MASINGVELKNIQKIEDETFENGSILKGTVYLNGKKLGSWSQDTNGGCDNFSFNENLLSKAVMGVKSTKKGKEAESYDVESFLCDLFCLCEREKFYKYHYEKAIIGKPVMLVGIDGGNGYEFKRVLPESTHITDRRKEEFVTSVAIDLRKEGLKLDPSKFEILVYRNPEDFVQTIGSAAGIKKELEAVERKKKEAEKKVQDRKAKEEQIAKNRKARNNGRFVPIKVDGVPYNEIKDTKTGRTVKVPLFAFSETLDAIIDLIC